MKSLDTKKRTKKSKRTDRRSFLKKAGATATGAVAATAATGPFVYAASNPIKWRLQSYSGTPLGAHVVKPQIEAFNRAAHGQMEIELYYADQLVPTDELFRAMQNGTIDAVQSDDATMASPVDINVFGGYFPFSTRYSLDLPVLFKYYGLDKIWAEAYGEIKGVEWLSAGAWDPLHIFTKEPIRKLADMKGKRVFGVPTAGKFLSRYGLVPVTVPWDDVEVAIQTGAWCGSYFANTRSWEKVPPHLQELFRLSMDSSHYYRQVWYWGGEAKLRVEGKKMELTTIPAAEWDQVVEDSKEFWDELASISPRAAKVVSIFKEYSKVMEKTGVPYRYS